MKLEHLVNMEYDGENLVNDCTTISASKVFNDTYGAKLLRNGNWYQDPILDLMQEEVAQFEYDAEGNHLTVYLK